MGIVWVILIILFVWVVGFYAFVNLLKAIHTYHRKERIKEILYDHADYKLVFKDGSTKLEFQGKLFDL